MRDFLPISKEDMKRRGWDEADFICVTGDAYVDHPSFGMAIISRVVEAMGFRVAVIAQPDVSSPRDLTRFGAPKYAFLVNGGNSKGLVAGRLLAQCHLPFLNRHIVGLHHVRQFSDGLFLGLFPFHLFIFVSEVLNYLKLKKLKTLANAQPFFTLNS